VDHGRCTEPRCLSEGVRDVFVNGAHVTRDGAHTRAKTGRIVRGPGWTG
jgi:N-acyl-D-amino-acid deacylase